MARAIRGTKLNGKHLIAMTKLARGEKPSQVAKDMGLDVDTIYSWQRWPVFQEKMAGYVESLAREQLDRGVEEATVLLNEGLPALVQWMLNVTLGVTELKDQKRWRMALDLLHHAGILDKQSVLKALSEKSAAPSASVSLTLDQRRQAVLASGNEEIKRQLENFRPIT